MKRRTLLEKKIQQELDKAKEYTKAQNKRGEKGSFTLCCLSLLHSAIGLSLLIDFQQ